MISAAAKQKSDGARLSCPEAVKSRKLLVAEFPVKICMFVRNDMTRDGRVRREAQVLVGMGHQVIVYALPGSGRPAVEELDGFTVKRIVPRYHRLYKIFKKISGRKVRSTASFGHNSGDGQPAGRTAGQLPRAGLLRRVFWLIDPHFCRRTLSAAIAEQADVYHAHDLITLRMGHLAARRTGARLVYDSHELYLERNPFYLDFNPLSNWRLKRREQKLIRRTDAVITINQSISEALARRYAIEPPLVLMNCPMRFARPATAGAQPLRKLLNLDATTPIVLYQGSLVRSRGLHNLVRAAHDLDRGVIVLLGWGELEAELTALIATEGLSDRVRLVPPVPLESLLEFTACADVGVIPYENDCLNNYYSTPNKLFEYIAVGLPIVASDFPELKKFVEAHELGLTFNPEEPKAIAGAINSLLADKSRLEALRQNSLKAAALYNWERESEKLRELYRRLERL